MKYLTLATCILIEGCTYGNGHICGPQTAAAYCDADAYEKLAHPKPYGAHWVLAGMTDEQRLEDIQICGGGRDLYIGFPEAKIKAERRAEETNDFAARARLSKAWGECMKAKGYHYQE